MAVTTDFKSSKDPNQGAQRIILTPATMTAYLVISTKNLGLLYLKWLKVTPTIPAKKANA